MIWFAYLTFAIIVRVPEPNEVVNFIHNRVEDSISSYLIAIVVITILNFFCERKIEKRNKSYEFLVLAGIHIAIVALALTYYSLKFYHMSTVNSV